MECILGLQEICIQGLVDFGSHIVLNRHVFGRQYGIEQDPQRCDWSWLGVVKVSDPDCVLKFGRSFGNVNVHAPIIHFSNIKKSGIVGTRRGCQRTGARSYLLG